MMLFSCYTKATQQLGRRMLTIRAWLARQAPPEEGGQKFRVPARIKGGEQLGYRHFDARPIGFSPVGHRTAQVN